MTTVMERSQARSRFGLQPRWKERTAAACAILLSLLFLASGIWKFSDLDATAERMVQSLIPAALSMPAAIAVAVCETLAAVLLLVPGRRRWGAWLAGLMLAAFMVYIGVLYDRLLGEDCNCFPWIRRVVGPVFFIGDAAMLILAAVAGWWSEKSYGWRRTGVIFLCVLFAAAASYTATAYRRGRADAPETVVVDGKPLNLRNGRVLLYFFDPECTHCYAVAREMARQRWDSSRIVVLATREQRFTSSFLADTGLRAGISPDGVLLRQIFPFTDPPYAVALERGRAVATFNSGQMEGRAYYDALRNLGYLK